MAAENDLVLIDLGDRRRDLMLTCGQAEEFALALEGAAAHAEAGPRTLYRGEPWGARVESFDGKVAVRFSPPHAGAPGRVPLRAGSARLLAEAVRWKAGQAEHKTRFVFGAG